MMSSAAPPPSPDASPLVLIVDDDADVRELTAMALATRDYRVAVANHGQEALEQIALEVPRLILLDMRMPVMDGWTFARLLREQYGHSIPVVTLTAAEDPGQRAAEVGAEGHLGKPFELDELFRLLEQLLGRP